VLAAIGCVQKTDWEQAATALYETGKYQDNNVTVRLLAFGDRTGELDIKVPQILFDQMLRFVHQRFRAYERQKSSVGNWTPDGQALKHLAVTCDLSRFLSAARCKFGLPPMSPEEQEHGG